MKKFLFLLISVVIFLTGCDRHSVIVFNDEPFSKDNFNKIKTDFKLGDRVYYLFATEKEMTCPYIRVQMSTITDKNHELFFKPMWAKDFKLMKDEMYFFTDYIVPNARGKYLIQVFRRDNLHKALGFAYFIVN